MNDLGLRLKDLQLKTQKLEDIESYPVYVDEFLKTMDEAEIVLREDMNKL
jgi:hypothetical protein